MAFLSYILALIPGIAFAQIVQFSGAPAPSAFQYLADQYGTPPLLLSTTKERSAYGGNCMTIRRASDSATQALGWINTKQCDATTFTTFCASTTCFLTTWNDQSGNGLDCVQATTGRQPQVIKDTDNLISIKATGTGQGCEVPDNAAIRLTQPHLYMVRSRPFPTNGAGNQVLIAYTATGTVDGVARWAISYNYNVGFLKYTRNASTSGLDFGAMSIAGNGDG